MMDTTPIPALKISSHHQYAFLGMFIIFITLGIFGGWAVFAPLGSASIAQGAITVKGKKKSLQHLDGGILTVINVRDGDNVHQGDLLIELDNTDILAELSVLKNQLISLRSHEVRLISERDGLDKVSFPDEIFDLNRPRAIQETQNQSELFLSRKNAREGELEVLKLRVDWLQSQVDGLTSLVQSKESLLESLKSELDELEDLLAKGYVDKRRSRELQRRYTELEGEIAEHSSAIAQSKIRMGETQLQILQNGKEFKNAVIDELAQVQNLIFDIKEKLTVLKQKLKRTTIIAPISGVVFNSRFHSAGEVISPADNILEIVPNDSELIVSAKLKVLDRDKVHIGQQADLRFNYLMNSDVILQKTIISNISADTSTDEFNNTFYIVELAFDKDGLSSQTDFIPVPGMPVEVIIQTGQQTFFQYITKPITRALDFSLIEN